jgi:hypothetical protein
MRLASGWVAHGEGAVTARLGAANTPGLASDADGRGLSHRLHQLVDGSSPAISGQHEHVDVLGEPLDDPVALGEARAALEDEVVGEIRDQDAEDLADPVVLLDRGGTDVAVLGDHVQGWSELIGVAEAHQPASAISPRTDSLRDGRTVAASSDRPIASRR